jgi:flagellar biosynthesis protein
MTGNPQSEQTEGATEVGHCRPARVAAALAYDPGAGAAPRLVAAGHGLLAERIIALAADSGVAVHENGDLAEVLAALDLGQAIPVALYAAVAEIIAFLHRRPAIRPAAAHSGAHL